MAVAKRRVSVYHVNGGIDEHGLKEVVGYNDSSVMERFTTLLITDECNSRQLLAIDMNAFNKVKRTRLIRYLVIFYSMIVLSCITCNRRRYSTANFIATRLVLPLSPSSFRLRVGSFRKEYLTFFASSSRQWNFPTHHHS